MTDAAASHTYGDDPLDGLDGDLIGRSPLVARVVNTFLALDREAGSAVMALTGPWGSGKTSVLGAVRTQLIAEGVKVCTYSPWAYTSLDSAVMGFFAELRSAFPESGEGSRPIRDAISGVMLKAAPLGRLGKLAGIDAEEALTGLAEVVRGDRSPDTLRQELIELLGRTNQRVCLVIDDLDRLEPPELVLTFRLVRFLGRLPGVNYLLAFDEQTLSDVLTRTGLVGGELSRARAYLEKVVQLWVDIPALSPEQQLDLLNSTLDPVIERHGTIWNDELSERTGELWRGCLRRYLDQPRSFKRLASQLDASWSSVSGEVDPVDLLAVTFMRTFEPGLFDLVVRKRDELIGTWEYVSWNTDKEAIRKEWESRVYALKVRYPQECMKLLSLTFTALGGDSPAELRAAQRLGSSEYFDRYVSLGLKPNEVSDVQVRAAVKGLHDGDSSALDALAQLNLESLLTRLTDLPSGSLPLKSLRWLAELYPHALEHPRTSGLGGSLGRIVESLLTKVLKATDPGNAAAAVKDLLAEGGTLQAALVVIRDSATGGGREDGKVLPLAALKGDAATALKAHLVEASHRIQVRDIPVGRVGALLFALADLTSKDEARYEIWRLIEDGASLWGLEDILASLVGTATRLDGRREEVLRGLDLGGVDELLDLERVRSAIIRPAERIELDEYDLSWGSRLKFVYATVFGESS